MFVYIIRTEHVPLTCKNPADIQCFTVGLQLNAENEKGAGFCNSHTITKATFRYCAICSNVHICI